ncbi:MAG: PfkB family carbohydrate kinase [Candidatus Sumerlaeota bacterium]|nr:PfkB family carbohydrate kinase [Candidatus Sumerlaeota bacterium]
MNVLVVGSVALDTVETPYGKLDRGLGGAATYASVAASHFAKPGIVGVVGKDFDRKHIRLLQRRGIDLEGLQIDPNGKTFHWSGFYDGDLGKAHTRATELNVFADFKPVIPDSYRKAPVVLLGNIAPSLQLEVLAQVKKPRLVLCDTMNYWISSAPRELEKVFRKVTVICINEDEARQFCNKPSLPAAAAELLKLGPERVIIKKGSSGVLLFGKDSFFALPAIPLKTVRDTTGAGDSFAGGFIGSLAGARRLTEAEYRRGVVCGTILASYCVEDFSCRRTARVTPADIRKRVALLREITQIPKF